MQCGLASKQSQKATIQSKHTKTLIRIYIHRSNKNFGLASKQFHKATIKQHTCKVVDGIPKQSDGNSTIILFVWKNKTKQIANTKLLEGIQFVDASGTPNSHNAATWPKPTSFMLFPFFNHFFHLLTDFHPLWAGRENEYTITLLPKNKPWCLRNYINLINTHKFYNTLHYFEHKVTYCVGLLF